MPTVADQPRRHMGEVIGNGHCVAHVREVAGLPHTSKWRRGVLVHGSGCASGTAIATFDDDGSYGNHTDGRSHAALLLVDDESGLSVVDQWVGQPVHERVIRFQDGGGKAVNDGDRYFVIELDADDG